MISKTIKTSPINEYDDRSEIYVKNGKQGSFKNRVHDLSVGKDHSVISKNDIELADASQIPLNKENGAVPDQTFNQIGQYLEVGKQISSRQNTLIRGSSRYSSQYYRGSSDYSSLSQRHTLSKNSSFRDRNLSQATGSEYSRANIKRKKPKDDKQEQKSLYGSRKKKKKKQDWTDRSMLSHILTYILVLFSMYLVSFVFMLYNFTDYYIEALTSEVQFTVKLEQEKYIDGIINSTSAQAQVYFNLTETLIEKQVMIVQDLLQQKTRNEAKPHPLNWQDENAMMNGKEAKKMMEDLGDIYQGRIELLGTIYHKTKRLNSIEKSDAKKIQKLTEFTILSMVQDFGLGSQLAVNQTYIQIERGSSKTIYSYPAILEEGNNFKSILQQGNDINQIYTICKTQKKGILNYANYDIATNQKRVAQIAYPLLDRDGSVLGAIVWENDLKLTFEQTIVPQSYIDKRYQFIQFRLIEYPSNGNRNQRDEHFQYMPDKKDRVISRQDPNSIKGRLLQTYTDDELFDVDKNSKGGGKKWKRDIVSPSEKFNLSYPMGEIIYEKNGDKQHLGSINTNPEYIMFVNKLQQMAIESDGHQVELHSQDFQVGTKYFRLFGKSMRAEKNLWTKDGENADLIDDIVKERITNNRDTSQKNMIIIIVEDVDHQEHVITMGTNMYIIKWAEKFQQWIIALSGFLNLYLICVIISIIKMYIVNPVTELTDFIDKPQSMQSIEGYVDSILKRAARRHKQQTAIKNWKEYGHKKLHEFKNRKNENPLDHQMAIMKHDIEIDEVDQLRLLFSQFFKQNTKIQDSIQDQIQEQKSDKDKDAVSMKIHKKKGANKIRAVMMMGEEQSVNYNTIQCQLSLSPYDRRVICCPDQIFTDVFIRLIKQEDYTEGEKCALWGKQEIRLIGYRRGAVLQKKPTIQEENVDDGEESFVDGEIEDESPALNRKVSVGSQPRKVSFGSSEHSINNKGPTPAKKVGEVLNFGNINKILENVNLEDSDSHEGEISDDLDGPSNQLQVSKRFSVQSQVNNLKMQKVASKMTDVGNDFNKSGMGFGLDNEDIVDEEEGDDGGRQKLVDVFDVFDSNVNKIKIQNSVTTQPKSKK